MDADRRVAELATRQHGRISTAQLIDAGLSRSAIRHRVASGLLHRIHRGVFAVGHRAATPLGREAAALLACGAGSAVSHRSAAVLWGLLARRDADAVDVSVPPPRRPAHAGIRVHRPAELLPADVRILEGLRVTSPARTVRDLAPDLSARELELVVIEARVRGLLRRQDLTAAGARLRALLEDEPRMTRSEAERALLALLRRAGLPPPETNVRIAGLEVDALWRGERLVVEVDGFAFHGHRAAFERDRRRDARLRTHGLTPIRLSWHQLHEEPEAVVADIAGRLAERQSRASSSPSAAAASAAQRAVHRGRPS